MKTLWLIVMALLALAIYDWASEREVSHPPGILVPQPPQQIPLAQPTNLEKTGYRITALAQFSLSARVLHKERYWLDRAADLAPIDFALGWGPMSDQKVLDQLDISQSGRRYFWWATSLPISAEEINSHSANMHLIPANEEITARLKDIRCGEIIALRGYLVSVKSDKGWTRRSSLSRTDQGDGACEVVWVDSLAIR